MLPLTPFVHEKNIGYRLCDKCKGLDFSSLAREELPRSHQVTFTLGFLSDIVQNGRQESCQFCQLVVKAFIAVWKQKPPPTTIDGRPIACELRNRAVCVVRYGDQDQGQDQDENQGLPYYSENFAANNYRYSNCRITITCDRAPPGCPATVELQHVDDTLDIRGLFDDAKLLSRRPRSQLVKINFDLVKMWISHCSQFHGDQCKPEPVPQDSHDNYVEYFRLIDVRRNCVVEARADWDYVTLSYVWGQSRPMLKLVLENKTELYEDGILEREKHRIPRTVLDAIDAVRFLDRRYLWVDALCIMQDDYVEKSKVIGEMDLIYNRAALALVAGSGKDANSGLPGLTPGTRDIDAFDDKISFGAKEERTELRVARPSLSTAIGGSTWNTRGWTYQERLFSNRILLFTDEQLFYWCGKSSWCEDTVMETDNENFFNEEMPLYRFRIQNDSSSPFMKQLQESSKITMFEEYSKSVFEFCSRDLTFPGDVLDAAAGLLRSLKSSYKPNPHPLIYHFGLPSTWFESALCWDPVLTSKVRRRDAIYRQGTGSEVPFPSWSWTGWVGRIEYMYPGTIEARIRPEVEWYKYDEQGFIVQVQTGEDTSPTPPSWLDSSTGPRPLRAKWKPQGAPVDICQSGVLDQEPSIHPRTDLLLFYSSCAFLPVVERDDGLAVAGNKTNPTRQYFIVGESKGWIRIDAEWMTSNPAPTYEFVVINRALNSDWRDPGMLDSLNVMLIERRGEIAYRVGMGSVSEALWADAESEWKFIQLG